MADNLPCLDREVDIIHWIAVGSGEIGSPESGCVRCDPVNGTLAWCQLRQRHGQTVIPFVLRWCVSLDEQCSSARECDRRFIVDNTIQLSLNSRGEPSHKLSLPNQFNGKISDDCWPRFRLGRSHIDGTWANRLCFQAGHRRIAGTQNSDGHRCDELRLHDEIPGWAMDFGKEPAACSV